MPGWFERPAPCSAVLPLQRGSPPTTLSGQLVDVERVVEQGVFGIAFHRVVAEIGGRVDVVAQLERQLDGLEPLRFGDAGERAGRLAFPVVEPAAAISGVIPSAFGIFGSAPCSASRRMYGASPLWAAT